MIWASKPGLRKKSRQKPTIAVFHPVLLVKYVFFFLIIFLELSMRCLILQYSNVFSANQRCDLGKIFLGTPLITVFWYSSNFSGER